MLLSQTLSPATQMSGLHRSLASSQKLVLREQVLTTDDASPLALQRIRLSPLQKASFGVQITGLQAAPTHTLPLAAQSSIGPVDRPSAAHSTSRSLPGSQSIVSGEHT
jgi:hypothetical protein